MESGKRAAADLLPVLRALDSALQCAVATQQSQWSAETLTDRFRGLYVSYAEAEQWLQRVPGAPLFSSPDELLQALSSASPLHNLGEIFSLSPFDLSIVTIAMAPEIDLRYERLYAFLQDDVTRKLPSLDLALSLLCSSAEEKLARRGHFASDAPLCRHRIIRLVAESESQHPPLLSHGIKLDDRILDFLLGNQALDKRLLHCCRLRSAMADGVPPMASGEMERELDILRQEIHAEPGPVIVHLCGGSALQMQEAAEALAERAGLGLLTAELEGGESDSIQDSVSLVLREARLQHAIPYFTGVDEFGEKALAAAFRNLDQTVVIATLGSEFLFAGQHGGALRLRLARLDSRQRRHYWESILSRRTAWVADEVLDVLARRYRLTAEQIGTAVDEACAKTRHGSAEESFAPGVGPATSAMSDALFAAARARSGEAMATVARKVNAKHTWDDLVLPPATLEQLHEFCARVINSEYVLTQWGFERKLSMGKGTTAVFAGPSGTGKTIAAEVIANEIKLDLYKVDLAAVISKYIGETERNLDRIFTAAENSSAVLFFDEADALFGKRSEVRDSHDRYANIEISYLLQKMEAYEGAAILATNLGQNMDESFLRRFAFNIRFPFPEEESRRRIWSTIWPQETPLARDIDYGYLAGRFRFTGGNIKNVALAAAFLAADDGGVVSMMHLLRAIEREFEKMGKPVRCDELAAELRVLQDNSKTS